MDAYIVCTVLAGAAQITQTNCVVLAFIWNADIAAMHVPF
jgi:hypothetical protein